MAGFGSFMEGLQGGMRSMSDIQAAWDKRDLNNAVLSSIDNQNAGDDFVRKNRGLPALIKRTRKESIGERFANWLDQHLGSGDQALEPQAYVPPPVDEPPVVQEQQTAIPEGGDRGYYADGKRPDPYELWDDEKANGPKKQGAGKADEAAKRDAARSRASTQAKVTNRTETVMGRDETAGGKPPPKGASGAAGKVNAAADKVRTAAENSKPGQMLRGALPEGAGAIRKGANALGKVAAPLALGETGMRVFDTPTEDYRKRFGMETDDPSFLGDVAARTLGAASDLGSVLTFGAADRFYRDKQQAPEAIPTEAAPAPATAPAPAEAIPSGPTTRGGAAPRPAPVDPKFEVPDPAAIDWSKLKGVDIPQYDTKDWVEFRQQAAEEYIMTHRGVTNADAEMYADQQVTAMQQSGFMQYLKQTAVLLNAGDAESAAKAAAMAFHFMPTGTSVKPGVYNGKAVLFPYDEETGQPEGNPVVLTPQLLSDIATQFGNPANWEKVVQDRQGLTQKDRQLDQMDTQLGIMQQNADTNATYYGAKAATAGQPGALKPVDIDRVREPSLNLAYSILNQIGTPQDEAAGNDIAEAILRVYAESNGQIDINTTARQIRNLLMQDPDGLNKLRAELARQ